MAYLFLSYCKADRDTALIMHKMLEDQGFRVWMDTNTRELEQEHWPLVEAAIQGSAALILLVSDAAQKSAWLKRELDFAESVQKPIFPILIQGKGWSRLQREALTLAFGLNMDFPESYLAELKTLLSSTGNPLPAPIILKPVNPAEKKKRLQRRWIALLALIVVLGFMLIPLMKHNSQQEEIRRSAMTNEASRSISMTSTAISHEATRVQSQANATASIHLTETAESREQLAATATEAANMAATQSYQYWIDLTATTGNGTLPCTALARQDGGVSVFSVYERPSFESSFSRLRRENGEALPLLVNGWIVNEDGSWYQLSTLTNENLGYALADELELDETCPR